MQKAGFIFYAIIFVTIIFASSEGQRTNIGKAEIEFIEGSAQVRMPVSDKWVNAYESAELFRGCRFRTMGKSRAGLRLEDGSEIRLNELTQISLDFPEIYGEAQTGPVYRRLTEIFVDSGEVWCDSRVDSYVRTVGARFWSRNGIYCISVGDDSSTEAKSYSGKVVVRYIPDRSKIMEDKIEYKDSTKNVDVVKEPEYWSRELLPYKMMTISSKGEIISSGDFDPESIAEKTEWIEWNKKRDNIE